MQGIKERESLIESNMGLVHACVKRFVGKGIDYDDLFQAGCVGLVKAADGFDSDLGFAFSTYAVPAILGEVKRLFRDGGAVKVSRFLKERSREILGISGKLEKFLGREPTVKEIADDAGITPQEASELLLVNQPTVSLTGETDDGEKQLDLPIDSHEERVTERLALSQCISELSDFEREIIELRYFRGLTQSACAQILKISQVQVSRKEKAALAKMRNKLVV